MATKTRPAKAKHKIELGAPGTIDSTYTVRDFLLYEKIVVKAEHTGMATAAVNASTNANLGKSMTFAEWQGKQ